MKLTNEEQLMLQGENGKAVQKAMQILATLGKIYHAECLIPVTSVQVAGVSYDNLGEAGLEFLEEMVEGGGKARVLSTLNPAGMDISNWEALGIDSTFAHNQQRVIDAYTRMGIIPSCTCTPYLAGNLPHFGEHIAWAESSAVCFANSVLGARTNREGGPSALASALTGLTPAYGYHLEENRQPELTVHVTQPDFSPLSVNNTWWFGALGKAIGLRFEGNDEQKILYITGIHLATMEDLKAFSASLATYCGAALFHMHGITPEASSVPQPSIDIKVSDEEIEEASLSMQTASAADVDFISLGCPHLSINEISHLAKLLEEKKVVREFWITTARSTKEIADRAGYTKSIEASGAKLVADTCCVVAPIKNRFHAMATDSAKACYYGSSKNAQLTRFLPFEQVIQLALIPPDNEKNQ